MKQKNMKLKNKLVILFTRKRKSYSAFSKQAEKRNMHIYLADNELLKRFRDEFVFRKFEYLQLVTHAKLN